MRYLDNKEALRLDTRTFPSLRICSPNTWHIGGLLELMFNSAKKREGEWHSHVHKCSLVLDEFVNAASLEQGVIARYGYCFMIEWKVYYTDKPFDNLIEISNSEVSITLQIEYDINKLKLNNIHPV